MPFYVVRGLVLTLVVYIFASSYSHSFNPIDWTTWVSIIATFAIWKCWDDE